MLQFPHVVQSAIRYSRKCAIRLMKASYINRWSARTLYFENVFMNNYLKMFDSWDKYNIFNLVKRGGSVDKPMKLITCGKNSFEQSLPF